MISAPKDPISIPVEFIRTLSRADRDVLFGNGGYLDAEQCARLWRMTDRQDVPPKRLQLLVDLADVMRVWPPSRQQRRAASRKERV
jgi:hypothetical protein